MSVRRELRRKVLQTAEWAYQPILGAFCGAALGLAHWTGVPFELSPLFGDGWQWAAFSALSALAGFMLAALALAASLQGHERAKGVLDSNVGRFMLRRMVEAMWAWFAAACVALLAGALPAALGAAVFLVALGAAVGWGVTALRAFTRFYARFTKHLPWRRD